MLRLILGVRTGVFVALVLVFAMDSGAREIYRQDSTQMVSPPAGQVAPVLDSKSISFEAVRRGMISFDLQRAPTSSSGNAGGVPVRFRGEDGVLVFLLRVAFQSEQDPMRAAIHLVGPEFARKSLGLWSPLILLDKAIVPGQTVHVDLTWDDDAKVYGLFVDGRAVDARPGSYDPETGSFVRDRRQVANEVAATHGELPAFPQQPLGYFLSKVRTVAVGGPPDAGRANRGGRQHSLVEESVARNVVVAVDEPLTDLQSPQHDVKGLSGARVKEGVALSWAPPEVHGIDQQYTVYRRVGAGGRGRFEKVTAEPMPDLTYTDTSAVPGETYQYSVASVYGDLKGGYLEGKYPPVITVPAAGQFVATVAAEKPFYGGCQEIVVTLRGVMDRAATFTVDGVTPAPVAMAEIDDGVYVGKVAVPAGLNLPAAALTGTLTDPASGEVVTTSGGTLVIDAVGPGAVPRILATVPWAGEIELAWDSSPAADVAEYRIYRGEGADPVTTGAAYETTAALSFTDTTLIPGIEYRYTVVPVDNAGNPGARSDIVAATAVAGDGPKVSAVTVEPFGRPARPGAVLSLTLTGQSGGTATLDLGTLATGIALTETGRSGVYTATYTVPEAAVAATKSSHRLVAHLADAFGATAQAGPELVIVGLDALNDHTAPVIAGASHDGFQVAGFSGTLVAGDLLSVTLQGEPYGYASFAIDGVTSGVEMTETPPGSGTYTGSYTVGWGDEGAAATLTATLADEAGNATTTAVGKPLAFDTRVRLSVTASDTLLPADRESQARLEVQAADANGGAVSGHELSLMLSTTEEYTGVVGGGDVEGRRASKDDLDDLEVKWGGTTDFNGKVAATYTAGFAAKTALIVVKDLTTGDVGAGWLNTYVASTVAITLTPVNPRAQRGMADQAVLTLTADPAWLTADGRSKSRLTATLRSLAGAPIEGARISFALAGDNGRLKILDSRTDARGVAEAEYRAGTLIGSVTVTAASADYGVTAAVQITLMSDAPAKIDLVASAVSLPADGKSTATLAMRVTDIHDNPNDNVPVTLAILGGSGSLSTAELFTDRNGEGAATYTAGSTAGQTVIEARHTSRAPTTDELRRVYGTVFVPRLLERQERERIKVIEWLAEPGDEVVKGQPLVVLEMRDASWTLTAPASGVFVREVKHRRDRVELGDTLGYVEIDPDDWTDQYAE
ncbi:MAG: invasin domain 3-containing protein [Deferrisomatales bacterium]|nr:invasin domain 3-containing protein [Deferrisomatales bacterium]